MQSSRPRTSWSPWTDKSAERCVHRDSVKFRITLRDALSALGLAALLLGGSGSLAADPALTVHRIDGKQSTLTIADIRKLPTRKATFARENGPTAEYEGVAVSGLLSAAGVALGKSLRGKRLSEYLLVTAKDGYEVVFALPEVDPEFTDKVVLLCFLKDGAPLPGDEGPLRLIVPGEKRNARSARQVSDFWIKK